MNRYISAAIFTAGVIAGVVWQLTSGIIGRPLAAALVIPMAAGMAYSGWSWRAESARAREKESYQRGRRDGIDQAFKTFGGVKESRP